jgi:hypothetical protein
MRKNVFAVLVLAALPVFGQATWGGLRFGMTEAEVKAVLKGRVVATGNPPGTEMYTPLRMPSVTAGSAKGMGTLSFNIRTKTLQRVWLDFSRHDTDSSAELPLDDSSIRITTYGDISRSLLEKYGRPVNETGYCPTEDEMVEHFVHNSGTIKCTRLWRQQHQTIEMDLSVPGRSLFLWIEYNSTTGGAASEL